ncbi:hypothetical protein C9F11_47145 (plasmid) [Streptomyces sp. YIM 121038]|uniref:hypothetical protein n=1 Tax=Streptomyces sp. YIM 121038 TaxID=2136401 RepID=UPI00111008D0|nr:hypothetical protein [Streptomyces sp. YIM 121038]QCX73710.1 hypothetical protein C9F11_00035 [Streptomyces sp. YIM 121038]QCX82109.1 hypothetical protein C9F11_42645 [Streptomyces sp. YIM 121038]QCX82122.1 hypothetical protein C9F11_42710 [Streptomyces sp. YIM 121038]QCX82976.1 hypothetical protein C9F11_47145 [Streptomyces sp. YIM 121038]
MTADRPVCLLRYADELTWADVEAVHDYLMDGVRPLAYDGPSGNAQRTALGFATALTHLAAALHHDLLYRQSAGPAVEAERLRRVRATWNSVWHLAAPWRGAEGYDARRWLQLTYLTRHDEKEHTAR